MTRRVVLLTAAILALIAAPGTWLWLQREIEPSSPLVARVNGGSITGRDVAIRLSDSCRWRRSTVTSPPRSSSRCGARRPMSCEDPNLELKQFLEKLAKNQQIIEKSSTEPIKTEILREEKSISVHRMPNLDHNNAIDYVLHLTTDKAMTSRDIQITLKRSREHTSRLMKKLFEDGYVQRNTNTKPYTYSITKKGKEKIEAMQSNSIIA